MKNIIQTGKPSQDALLKALCCNNQDFDWNQFSSKIVQKSAIIQKLPSQCQIKCSQQAQNLQVTIEWTQAEQRILIQRHTEIGNKWASISHSLKSKSDNCVKNHFYSKLRKMIRKLNRIIQTLFKKQIKVIGNQTIYKLVQASEERFKQNPICTRQVSMMAQGVISSILLISLKGDPDQKLTQISPQIISQYKEIIEQINQANKNYKKKSKKLKNSSIKAPVRKKKVLNLKYSDEKNLLGEDLEGDDQYSSAEGQMEQESISKNNKKKPSLSQKNIIIKGPTSQKADYMLPNQAKMSVIIPKVQIKTGQQIQLLLQDAGLLQSQQTNNFGNSFLCKSGWSVKSYSQCGDNSQSQNHFFDDSNPRNSSKKFAFFSKFNPSLMGDSHSAGVINQKTKVRIFSKLSYQD